MFLNSKDFHENQILKACMKMGKGKKHVGFESEHRKVANAKWGHACGPEVGSKLTLESFYWTCSLL